MPEAWRRASHLQRARGGLADDRAQRRRIAGAAEHASGAQEVRDPQHRSKVHLRGGQRGNSHADVNSVKQEVHDSNNGLA